MFAAGLWFLLDFLSCRQSGNHPNVTAEETRFRPVAGASFIPEVHIVGIPFHLLDSVSFRRGVAADFVNRFRPLAVRFDEFRGEHGDFLVTRHDERSGENLASEFRGFHRRSRWGDAAILAAAGSLSTGFGK